MKFQLAMDQYGCFHSWYRLVDERKKIGQKEIPEYLKQSLIHF